MTSLTDSKRQNEGIVTHHQFLMEQADCARILRRPTEQIEPIKPVVGPKRRCMNCQNVGERTTSFYTAIYHNISTNNIYIRSPLQSAYVGDSSES